MLPAGAARWRNSVRVDRFDQLFIDHWHREGPKWSRLSWKSGRLGGRWSVRIAQRGGILAGSASLSALETPALSIGSSNGDLAGRVRQLMLCDFARSGVSIASSLLALIGRIGLPRGDELAKLLNVEDAVRSFAKNAPKLLRPGVVASASCIGASAQSGPGYVEDPVLTTVLLESRSISLLLAVASCVGNADHQQHGVARQYDECSARRS